MSFLDAIARCNQFNLQEVYPFFVGKRHIGWIQREHAKALRTFPDYFIFSEKDIRLIPQASTYKIRTTLLATVVAGLKERGQLSNWRGEIMDVAPAYGEMPLFALERGAAAFFGVPTYGTHLNGYTYHNGELHLWIAQRARQCVIAPGGFDNLAAGGLPRNLTPARNMLKKAWEEARLPAALVKKAVTGHFISYLTTDAEGVRAGGMFTFDLELSPNIIPKANSQEIETFYCWPAQKVYDLVKNTRTFKDNSALVMIDFLLRKQIITLDEPDYQTLSTHLQRPFLFQTENIFLSPAPTGEKYSN